MRHLFHKKTLWFIGLIILLTAVHLTAHIGSTASNLFKAESFFEYGKLDSAKALFEQILKTDENSIRTQLGLGQTLVEKEDWGDAKDHFKKALKIEPENLTAKYYLGICYRETGKFKALLLRKWDWNKAEKYFEQTVNADSTFEDVLFQFARLRRYQENYRQAIILGHNQIRLRPELVTPQVKLFRLYRYFITHTNTEEAVDWLSRQPWDHAQFAIAEKYRREGHLDQADSLFRILLNKDADMPVQPVYLALARIHYEKDDKGAAEQFYQQAVQNISDDVGAELVFEDLKYILSNKEFSEFQQIESVARKKDFFRTFWARRNPIPASPTNLRLAEHYRRLIYAEQNYEYDGFRLWFNNPDQLGYFDFDQVYQLNHEFHDKGLIYIRHGQADEWAATSGMDVPTNESWLYYKIANQPKMSFHFMTHNSPSAWRFTPTITHPDILEDRLSWGNEYYRLYTADHLERLAATNELAMKSKTSVETGIATDRHTWPKEIEPFEVPLSLAAFRGDSGKTSVELYYSVPTEPFVGENQDSVITLKKGVSLLDFSWNKVAKHHQTIELPVKENQFAVDLDCFSVKPDSYYVSFYLQDSSELKLSAYKFKTGIKKFSEFKLDISDIQLASFIGPADRNEKFTKHQLTVIPNPSKTYEKEKPIYIYFEIYNLQKNSTGNTDFTIEYTLSFLSDSDKGIKNLFGLFGGGGKTSITTTIHRQGEDALSVEYLAIDVSKVKRGKHELVVKITDRNSGQSVRNSNQMTLK